MTDPRPAPAPAMTVRVTDYHTGGEPFRIVDSGLPEIPGATVADRRAHIMADPELDQYRRLLVNEPRGHADMYGGFIVPPDDDGAHFGVLFWHKDGYSTACGHGTIALGVWAVETGRVAAEPDGETDVVIDVPSGRVTARVRCAGGQVQEATFVNVPSWVSQRGIEVDTPRGPAVVDISWGGAMYVSLRAGDVGLAVTPEHYAELITVGRAVKWALNDHPAAQHPADPRLSGVYGTILWEELPDVDGVRRQRNVTVFADGEVDRSPCGSGTSARMPLWVADSVLDDGGEVLHDSIVGSRFHCEIAERTVESGRAAVIPKITGTAYRTGAAEFTLDPRDELGFGFTLR